MGRRMTIAFLSLVAGMSAVYLHLYKIGVVGDLSCSTGGCDRVMYSAWGSFYGIDVALLGAVGYVLLLAFSILSLQDRFKDARWPVAALLLVSSAGFLFTLRLKYGEFIELHTFCPWCAISAASITIITVLSVLEYRSTGRAST